MKSHLVLILSLFAAIGAMNGCRESSGTSDEGFLPTSPQAGLYSNNSISVGGIQRTYNYFIPSGLGSQAAPLIFLLHGNGGNADGMAGLNGSPAPFKIWMEGAESDKFIVVYPNGVLGPSGDSGWNDCRADATTNPSTDDVAFIAQLIEHFHASFNIDQNRIYASGISNGGHMSIRLTLELSDQIAAVAVIAAAMPENSKCIAAVRPTSILFMNGTSDPISPYQGGQIGQPSAGRGIARSTLDSVNYWTSFNQTNTTAVVVDFPDLDMGDDSTVRRYHYSSGIEQTEVVLYEIVGGGHNEPSMQEQYSAIAKLILGKQNHDIEMAQEAWKFFTDKRLQ